jgi:two-component system, OmpR family, response regulator CpxR
MDAASKQTPSSPSEVAVLVVEHEPDLRESSADFLREEGYTVFTAPDGMSALERLRTHPTPLIVLLDWYMPSMDGLQVLQALAEDTAVVQPHVFIMLTASAYEIRQRLSRDMAAIPAHLSVSVLGKPFDLDDGAALVARAAAHLAADSLASDASHA